MREILFRGKRVDNGEWVEGFYVNVPEHYKHEMSRKSYIVSINNGLFMEVVPETVGEYTRLTDKNGERIFEGDIVAFDRDNRHKGDVQFDWGVFGVEWTECKHNKEMVGVWGNLHNLRRFEDGFNKEVEVIGNIHDNPELLEDK